MSVRTGQVQEAIDRVRVLIVAEHASARFGGEAILPLHYFRLLRQRGVEAWLVVHARTRGELRELLPGEVERMRFVPDTPMHRALWAAERLLPDSVAYVTLGFCSRLLTQWMARRIARRLVREQGIDVVHQPIPVSPRESSLLYRLGAPVVIGPMNGGMSYPAGFRFMERRWARGTLALGRWLSGVVNRVMPGKRQAAVLLVANERTRRALPGGTRGTVLTLQENGVDLAVWRTAEGLRPQGPTRFVFVGRLVSWKGVDMLLEALQAVRTDTAATLEVIGDGEERGRLEAQASRLGLDRAVRFRGWRAQAECASAVREADALVLPSLYECGGAVVLEAMASGLPVIATDWGGPADYLDPSCGILVPPLSRPALVEGLAHAMRRLARDPALRCRMGEAGRRRVAEEFDWERKIDAMLDVYRRAIRGCDLRDRDDLPLGDRGLEGR